MRTITEEITLYTFAELSEKAKETARDNWRNSGASDMSWFYDDLHLNLKKENANEFLQYVDDYDVKQQAELKNFWNIQIENLDTCYGICKISESFYYEETPLLLAAIDTLTTTETRKKRLKALVQAERIEIPSYGVNWYNSREGENGKHREKWSIILDKAFEDYKKELKNTIESCLVNYCRAEEAYINADETIDEMLIANEYEFTENGKIY